MRFVQSNSKGKNKEVLDLETFPEESFPEESLDKGKGKAKVDKVILYSGSEYSAEYSEDSDLKMISMKLLDNPDIISIKRG
jgi:hypothetical protein